VIMVFMFLLIATILFTFGAGVAANAIQYYARISISIRNFLQKEERTARAHSSSHFIFHFYYPIFRFRLEV
jgi:5-bromo-4-chloroindolyl phosphate hydrolysis protein